MSNNIITLIYNSQQDWLAVANVIKKIYLDLYLNDDTIQLYNLNTTSSETIDTELENLYNLGRRKFVGFAASQLLESCLNFFGRHADTVCITVGSTIEKTFGSNIFRPQFSDNKYLRTFELSKRLDSYTKMILLEEQDNEWSHIFVQNIQTFFGEKYTYETHIINTLDYDESKIILDNIFSNLTSHDIIAPIFSLNTDNFIRIVNESNVSKMEMFCGDGMFGFDATLTTTERTIFAQKASIFVTIFYGNGSIYNVIYNNSFAINIIDVISAIRKNPDMSVRNAFNNYLGYNGLLTLNETNTRQYGKIIILNYGEDNNVGWKSHYVYENDSNLGEIIAICDNKLY